MDSVVRIIMKIFEALQYPIGWALAILSYFTPLFSVFYLILIIVVADFVAGILASRKKGIPRSSKRFRKSLEKLLCYLGVLWLFWEFENIIGIQEWVCTYKMIAGFIFLVEIISILENLAIITEQKIFLKIIKLIRGRAAMAEKEGTLVEDLLNEKNGKNESK